MTENSFASSVTLRMMCMTPPLQSLVVRARA